MVCPSFGMLINVATVSLLRSSKCEVQGSKCEVRSSRFKVDVQGAGFDDVSRPHGFYTLNLEP
jgi:hypothetical protein